MEYNLTSFVPLLGCIKGGHYLCHVMSLYLKIPDINIETLEVKLRFHVFRKVANASMSTRVTYRTHTCNAMCQVLKLDLSLRGLA